MLEQTAHKPDILEVIADLSNDEVRTPPRVANAMLDLLPEHVWANPDLRWLDPACKTGVFPREITKRLMVGLAKEIPDERERLEHILRDMVFGFAITELTALMSRRTVYCSKRADSEHSTVLLDTSSGHVWYERVEHSYLKGRCQECSASKRVEQSERDSHAYAFIHENGMEALSKEFDMKFDVIVGNPPYQMEADAAGQNIVPIYNRFVQQAMALDPRYVTMIIPSRWLAGGKWLDDFRSDMLGDRRIRVLVDYPNASELFPSVEIKGGVCYFLWDRDNPGACSTTMVRGSTVLGPTDRDLAELDVFVRDSRALPILRKVLAHKDEALSDLVSARDPFGPALSSNFKGYRKGKRQSGDLKLYMNTRTARVQRWVEPSVVTKNVDAVHKWKVLFPKAGSDGGQKLPDVVLGKPLVAEPRSVCTLTYLFIGPFDEEGQAQSAISYVRTRFVRFLVSLRKISQDTTRGSFDWVPQQSWDREWNDEELYEKYGITDEEQAYIAEMVKEMPA